MSSVTVKRKKSKKKRFAVCFSRFSLLSLDESTCAVSRTYKVQTGVSMTSFADVNRELCIGGVALSVCQDYLDQPHFRESAPFAANVPPSAVEDVLAILNTPGFVMNANDAVSAKRLLSNLLSSIVHASTSTGKSYTPI